jgi:hypothetical protein
MIDGRNTSAGTEWLAQRLEEKEAICALSRRCMALHADNHFDLMAEPLYLKYET